LRAELLGVRPGGPRAARGTPGNAPRAPPRRALPSLASRGVGSGAGEEQVMDQRRFLLALVLSFLLLYAYEQLVVRPYRTPPRPVPQGEAGTPESPPVAPGGPPSPALPPATPGAVTGLAAPPGDHPTVTVETDLFRATITTLGARLESFQLKDFRE